MATLTFPAFSSRLSKVLRYLSLGMWRWRAAWVITGLVVALLGASSLFNDSAAGPATVFVARTDLALGTVLSSGDFSERGIDIDPSLLGPLISRPELVGTRLSHPLSAGSLIRAADLVPTNLFAGAPPGSVFTVVTIENSGIISYLRPGMSVDLISSQPNPQETGVGPLAQGAIVVALGSGGDFSTNGLNPATPWAQTSESTEFSSTVLVATTADQSKALALSSQWQGVHAIIVQ